MMIEWSPGNRAAPGLPRKAPARPAQATRAVELALDPGARCPPVPVKGGATDSSLLTAAGFVLGLIVLDLAALPFGHNSLWAIIRDGWEGLAMAAGSAQQ